MKWKLFVGVTKWIEGKWNCNWNANLYNWNCSRIVNMRNNYETMQMLEPRNLLQPIIDAPQILENTTLETEFLHRTKHKRTVSEKLTVKWKERKIENLKNKRKPIPIEKYDWQRKSRRRKWREIGSCSEEKWEEPLVWRFEEFCESDRWRLEE